MIAWAIAILQSLGLVEREFRTEKLVNAHGIAIKIAIATQRELHAITSEPNRMTVTDLTHSSLLEHVKRHVRKLHITRFRHIGGKTNTIPLAKRTTLHRHIA